MLKFKFHLIDGSAVETDDRSDSPMFGSLDNLQNVIDNDKPVVFTDNDGSRLELSGNDVRSVELIFKD